MNTLNKLVLPAPAKLNLCLKIISRKENGYHNLQTIMMPIKLFDKLTFIKRVDNKITLHNQINNVTPCDNLIFKAAVMLGNYTQSKYGADIYLNKKIPIGAGLGGGSSDAATTLLGLNYLWQTNLPLSKLAELGLNLGADVPFFVHGISALAEGIGEKITALGNLKESWFLVIVPKTSIATSVIFNAKQLTRNSTACKLCDLLFDKQNDCAITVMQLYPEVQLAFNELNRFTEARITGTGSCVFGEFSSLLQAKQVAKKLACSTVFFISKGCNKSLLHSHLARLV